MPRMWILVAAVLMSTGGAGIKALSLSAMDIAGLRSAVAAIVFLVACRGGASGGGWSVDRRTVGVATVYAAMTMLYVAANRLTTAANTIFLQSTAPLYVLLAAPVFLGERISRRDVAYMLALGAGLAAFFLDFQGASATAPDPLTGNFLALLGGVGWAATILGLRSLASHTRGRSPVPALLLGNLLVLSLAAPFLVDGPIPPLHDFAIVVYLGVFQVAVAYLLFNRGVRKVPAFEASLLLLLEPVLNPLWAWAVHGEAPGHWALAGGAAIVGSTAIKILADARLIRSPPVHAHDRPPAGAG